MRPETLNPIFAEATSLKGVGAAISRALARLKLERLVDLLFHLPTGLIERVAVDHVEDGHVDRLIEVMLTIVSHERGGPRSPLRVRCADAQGTAVDLVFFGERGGWAQKSYPVGAAQRVSGRLERYNDRLQIVHPEALKAPLPAREPLYALTEGLSNRRLGALVQEAMSRAPALAEWIEPGLLAQKQWPAWRDALQAVHGCSPDAARARDRLAYDELLAGQLAVALVRLDTRRRRGRPLPGTHRLTDALIAGLPWALTAAQRRADAEIAGDMAQPFAMLRLLQGDVGSGKTLVAALAMLRAIESGAQAAMLAPTDILARQHHATLEALLSPLGIRIALLTGRDKGAARRQTLEALASGALPLVVGTHAIFQDGVTYHDLGVVVIDEQHRFGVAQRMQLAEKGRSPVHMLVMTATPIPRTLALTHYGEMDVTRIDELPPGRQPIATRVVSLERLPEIVAALGRHVEQGGQAYWVCPLVEESETGDLAAAEVRAALLREVFGARVGLVHGRQKAAERDAVMTAFTRGELAVLVATTVIEVGVDVPNASLMIIEAAERFGLAQLHQLRGRVGRGAVQSTCLLLRAETLSETARARLALLRETNDGFRIAEEDLRLRGAGEMLGTRQSGEEQFRLASPEHVDRLVATARDDARLLIERDGGLASPRGAAARTLLYLFERDAAVRLLRSG